MPSTEIKSGHNTFVSIPDLPHPVRIEVVEGAKIDASAPLIVSEARATTDPIPELLLARTDPNREVIEGRLTPEQAAQSAQVGHVATDNFNPQSSASGLRIHA